MSNAGVLVSFFVVLLKDVKQKLILIKSVILMDDHVTFLYQNHIQGKFLCISITTTKQEN